MTGPLTARGRRFLRGVIPTSHVTQHVSLRKIIPNRNEEEFYSLKNTIKVLQQPTVGQLSQPRSPRMEGWEDKQRPQH